MRSAEFAAALVYKASRKCHSERSRGIPKKCFKVSPRDVSTSLDMTSGSKSLYVYQFSPREAAKRLDVFGRTFFDHFLRQTRGRGSFVPIECL